MGWNNGANPRLASMVRNAIQELPALPAILTQILAMVDREDVTGSDLERVLGADQGLTARILRVANSAYYGLERQISSVGQASVILGMRQIRNLALSLSATSILKASTPSQRELHSRFWRESLACAIASQMIASCKKLNPEMGDSIYVAGLLHDVGRLFFYTNFTDLYLAAYKKAAAEGMGLREAEVATFGADHTSIGGELGRQWNFPPAIVEVIEGHEGPFDLASPSSSRSLAVNLANAIACEALGAGECSQTAASEAIAWAAFEPSEIEVLKTETAARVETFCRAVLPMAA